MTLEDKIELYLEYIKLEMEDFKMRRKPIIEIIHESFLLKILLILMILCILGVIWEIINYNFNLY